MSTLHLMIGIPGSGKSTYVNKLLNTEEGKKLKLVSTDKVRQDNPNLPESEVFPTVYKTMGEFLNNGVDVIFDATNITPKVRNRLINNLKQYVLEFDICGYFFPTYSKICMNRVIERNKLPNELYLPPEVPLSYGESITLPTYDEAFKDLKVIHMDEELLKDVIVDPYQGYAFYYRKKDQIIEEYSGFESVETYNPIKDKTCFRLASVSKQFIAYGIKTLIDNNKLSMDTTLYSLFDNMPEYTKNIKVSNLIYHTSGIYDYEDMDHTDCQVCDEDVLNYIRTTDKTYFEIGSKYQYSNTAYVILGLIIEKVSNEKIGDYLGKIFNDLGMTYTKVNYQGTTEFDSRAYGHIKEGDKFIEKDQYWCSATIGDGGIYSNVLDLKKWLKYISQDKYLEFKENILKPHILPNGENIEYGYGIRIKNKNNIEVVYHCGDTIGTNTIIGFIKDLDIEFILLTNINGIDTAKLIDNIIKKEM